MTRLDPQTNRSLGQALTKATGTAANSPILRSGVDIVGIARIARLLDEFDQSLKDRVFMPAEQSYCDSRPDPAQHYAARWAVKEAFRKAVATDGPSVPFDAVGVIRTADSPTLELAAPAEKALVHTLQRENASPEQAATSVSLAHDQPAGVAIAHVIIASGDSEVEADAAEPPIHEAER